MFVKCVVSYKLVTRVISNCSGKPLNEGFAVMKKITMCYKPFGK